MNPILPVSVETLQNAFRLAEDRIRGEANTALTQKIATEAKAVRYEGSLNAIIKSALSDKFSGYSIESEYPKGVQKKIDLCMIRDNTIAVAIESKGMVANSHSRDQNRISIDLHGIRTKLYPDKRSSNSVQTDIAQIESKILPHLKAPHFELFIPVVYELYRSGGSSADWFSEKKPWTTLPSFKQLRLAMKDDFAEWFYREDPNIQLIHAAESIELREANKFWRKLAQHKFPKFNSLEAYVSFFVFGRFVE